MNTAHIQPEGLGHLGAMALQGLSNLGEFESLLPARATEQPAPTSYSISTDKAWMVHTGVIGARDAMRCAMAEVHLSAAKFEQCLAQLEATGCTEWSYGFSFVCITIEQ